MACIKCAVFHESRSNPETTSGGNSLKFYSSVRFHIRRIGAVKEGDEVVGSEARVKVVKNKAASPFKQCETQILSGQSFNYFGELIDLGVKIGLIDKAGAWYSYKSDKIGQGKKNAAAFLEQDSMVVEELDKVIRGEWGGYAYGNDKVSQDGVNAKRSFKNRIWKLETVVQNQDNREHDLLDSDAYYQFQGGMANASTSFSVEAPVVYHDDHSNPAQPKLRTLKEELSRILRLRVLNSKWISAMKEHGCKGAFQMTASADDLVAYDATTNLIESFQYEQVADELIFNSDNQSFFQKYNPAALEVMAERLLEVTQRDLWQDENCYGERLQDLVLEIDSSQEMVEVVEESAVDGGKMS